MSIDRIQEAVRPLLTLADSRVEQLQHQLNIQLTSFSDKALYQLIEGDVRSKDLLVILQDYYSKFVDAFGTSITDKERSLLFKSIISICNVYDANSHGGYLYRNLDSLVPHLINLLHKRITTTKELALVLLKYVIIEEVRNKLGTSSIDMLSTIIFTLGTPLEEVPLDALVDVRELEYKLPEAAKLVEKSPLKKAYVKNSNYFN